MFYSSLFECKCCNGNAFIKQGDGDPVYEEKCPTCDSVTKAILVDIYTKAPGETVDYLYSIDPETHEQFKKEFASSQPSKPQQPTKLQVECPYCHNKNCSKIGIIGRGLSFGLFGFGSSKVGKQWHCNTCKSDF